MRAVLEQQHSNQGTTTTQPSSRATTSNGGIETEDQAVNNYARPVKSFNNFLGTLNTTADTAESGSFTSQHIINNKNNNGNGNGNGNNNNNLRRRTATQMSCSTANDSSESNKENSPPDLKYRTIDV
jgi:hypothetical protein